MLTVVAGAPFAGKDRWIASQIERREADGARGLLALSFTALFAGMVPGAESVYRDQEVSDSGAPRFTGWLLATAIAQAATRELSGYVAVDSPRRAVDLLGRIGGDSLIEVQVPEATAVARADAHVAVVSELSPRAGQDDAKARCLQMVRPVLRGARPAGYGGRARGARPGSAIRCGDLVRVAGRDPGIATRRCQGKSQVDQRGETDAGDARD